MPGIVICKKANAIRIEAHIYHHKLHWAGHFICLDAIRIPKQMLYATQPQHKSRKYFKKCLK